MKKIFLFLSIFALILSFSNCELFVDIDTTDNASEVSVKPMMQLIGKDVKSLAKGGTYTEQGVKASEVKLGDNDLSYEIVAGNVDPNTPGFYVVTYKAVNKYGWENYTYRAVLVYEGSPYGSNIAGDYKKGFLIAGSYKFETSIYKHSEPGFWIIDNFYQEGTVSIPAIFADMGDGTYNVVPGVDVDKGTYKGTAEKISGGRIQFTMDIVSNKGEHLDGIEFVWEPKP